MNTRPLRSTYCCCPMDPIRVRRDRSRLRRSAGPGRGRIAGGGGRVQPAGVAQPQRRRDPDRERLPRRTRMARAAVERARRPAIGLAGPSTNNCWNEQGRLRSGRSDARSRGSRARQHAACRRADPDARTLHSLADFCYAVRRDVIDAIGGADEAYGIGPCWEMDYNVRAARAASGACGSAARSSIGRRSRRGAASRKRARFEASRRRYQDKFCGARLRGEKTDYRAHCRGDACELRTRVAHPIGRAWAPAGAPVLASPGRTHRRRVQRARSRSSVHHADGAIAAVRGASPFDTSSAKTIRTSSSSWSTMARCDGRCAPRRSADPRTCGSTRADRRRETQSRVRARARRHHRALGRRRLVSALACQRAGARADGPAGPCVRHESASVLRGCDGSRVGVPVQCEFASLGRRKHARVPQGCVASGSVSGRAGRRRRAVPVERQRQVRAQRSRRRAAVRGHDSPGQHEPQGNRRRVLAAGDERDRARDARGRSALLPRAAALGRSDPLAARLLHHADVQPPRRRPARDSVVSAAGLPEPRARRDRRRRRSGGRPRARTRRHPYCRLPGRRRSARSGTPPANRRAAKSSPTGTTTTGMRRSGSAIRSHRCSQARPTSRASRARSSSRPVRAASGRRGAICTGRCFSATCTAARSSSGGSCSSKACGIPT